LDLNQIKLGICLPITSYWVPTGFFVSFLLMNKPREYQLILPKCPIGDHADSIASVRNDLVQQALECECTHIFMADTDQRYSENVLMQLLSYGLPVVYARVHRRYPPFDPILYRLEESSGEYYSVPAEEWKNNSLIEIDATGGGCLLIESSVFFDIRYPWYRTIPRNNWHGPMGEDILFCRKLKKAGYRIFADVSVNIGHFTYMEADENLYDIFNQCCVVKGMRNNQKDGDV